MLTSILAVSLKKCKEPLQKDSVLPELEAKILEFTKQLPQDSSDTMTDILSKYKARITKIAYLQGMRDIFDLFFTLSDEANEILATHEKK